MDMYKIPSETLKEWKRLLSYTNADYVTVREDIESIIDQHEGGSENE